MQPYTLYGSPASLYTGKARSYLRKQRIDFVEMSPGSDRYLNHIVPAVGRWIMPCLETPDGEIIQDGADIIDHFEKGDGRSNRAFSSYPDSPVLLAIAHLFELFGGEGLLRPAMHYRWNFDDENLAFVRAEFALNFPSAMSEQEAAATFDNASGRMRKAAANFGVNAESAPLIEAAFHEWLDLFSAHLADHPYLLGGVPSIGDFGLMAAMWAHLFRDPAPQALIKRHAPRVGRWVERMSTSEPYEHEYPSASGLLEDQQLPQTLLAMMEFVAQEYLPEISAHVETANEWLAAHPEIEAGTNGQDDPAARGLTGGRGPNGGDFATFQWRGIDIATIVLPYRFWLLQRLHDDLALADDADQARARTVFESTGLAPLLDLRTLRRVERAGHLEVWGAASTSVDAVPVAKTPTGGWVDWPAPVLVDCVEPRPAGSPDLDGYWRTIEVTVGGEVVSDHPAIGQVQRIEQAGDRVIVTGVGVTHDMRCDGTLANGVHDVAQFDKTVEVHVVASYESGVHVLRPDGLEVGVDPIEVRRWRDGEHLIWEYLGFTARLVHLAASNIDPADVVTA